MRAGTYIFSSLCSTTGIPFPLFQMEMVLESLVEAKGGNGQQRESQNTDADDLKPQSFEGYWRQMSSRILLVVCFIGKNYGVLD